MKVMCLSFLALGVMMGVLITAGTPKSGALAPAMAAPMPYVLIFNRSDERGEASTSAQFNSEEACDAAKTRIEAMDIHAGMYDVMCVPKG